MFIKIWRISKGNGECRQVELLTTGLPLMSAEEVFSNAFAFTKETDLAQGNPTDLPA
jgi:hypothetical protein